MKKLFLLSLLSLLSIFAFAQDFPEKQGTLVNDYANVLSAGQKQELEDKLVSFNDSSSTLIAIAILKSVGEYDINEYAVELGRKWGVGQNGKNNGIMIVVAVGDRKISIQTGYGLEGVLPDIYTKRIIDNDIKPNFRTGNYYAGLDEATTSIIKYTRGEYKNDQPKVSSKGVYGSIAIVIIIVVIIIIISLRGGGGSQVIGGRGASNALFWAMLFGSGGGGRDSGWGSGSSGDSGGGGGFGGFGGGSFGGGGSSGSW